MATQDNKIKIDILEPHECLGVRAQDGSRMAETNVLLNKRREGEQEILLLSGNTWSEDTQSQFESAE